MQRFVTSVLSLAAIALIYCVQRAARTLGATAELVTPKNFPPPGSKTEPPRSLTGRLHARNKRVFEKLSDPAVVLYLALEEMLSKLLSWIFYPFAGRSARLGQNYALQQLALAASAVGPERSIVVQQAQNTRYVFVLVRNNPEFLGIPKTGEFDLSAMLERAYGIGAFENIWSVEGLGHVYTQRAWAMKWKADGDATGILTDGQAASLPAKSLTMMHAGLGLGFAESLIKHLNPASTRRELESVLNLYIQLCQRNSRLGYVGCALESLGLVTRCFNYPLVRPIHETLAEVDPLAWEYFWRGAGRAIYFSPAHLLQPVYSPWIAAHQEAPDRRVLDILKSGLSWPANIVNMRTPQVFLAFLRRYGTDEGNHAAIINGVAASTTMAVDITPGHPVVEAYLDYVPETSDHEMRRLWEMLVHEPVQNAVKRYQPVLSRHNMLQEVFRFQDLEALVSGLELGDAAHGEMTSVA